VYARRDWRGDAVLENMCADCSVDLGGLVAGLGLIEKVYLFGGHAESSGEALEQIYVLVLGCG